MSEPRAHRDSNHYQMSQGTLRRWLTSCFLQGSLRCVEVEDFPVEGVECRGNDRTMGQKFPNGVADYDSSSGSRWTGKPAYLKVGDTESRSIYLG